MQKEELDEVFQMLLELMVAAVIGISFGNAWVCILMSFGARSEEKSVGLWFIAGRNVWERGRVGVFDVGVFDVGNLDC